MQRRSGVECGLMRCGEWRRGRCLFGRRRRAPAVSGGSSQSAGVPWQMLLPSASNTVPKAVSASHSRPTRNFGSGLQPSPRHRLQASCFSSARARPGTRSSTRPPGAQTISSTAQSGLEVRWLRSLPAAPAPAKQPDAGQQSWPAASSCELGMVVRGT